MKPRSANTRFLKRLAAAGLTLDTLTPVVGIEAMLAFYLEERADGCEFDEDGDMLLFQWAASDADGKPTIGFDITRQLMATDDEDDEPRQLRLCFECEVASVKGVGAGNRWCESPEGVEAFRKFIVNSPTLKAVAKIAPKLVELHFGRT